MRAIRTLLCALMLASVARGAENLVPNGSFDTVEWGLPRGWARLGGSPDDLLYADQGAAFRRNTSRFTGFV